MDALLARYFDGELTEDEARELLDAADANPKLERELRAYERVLSTAKTLRAPRAPAGFTERVMETITAEPERKALVIRPTFFRRPWVGAAVAAAVVIVAFVGGLRLGRSGPNGVLPGTTATPPEARVTAIDTETPAVRPAGVTTESGLRYVRLVYVPREESVQNVAVAGSFSQWDPMPLQRQDGVFSTILVLPPGSYEYMFVENGERWVTDPLAARTRDDGFGTTNAVLDVEI